MIDFLAKTNLLGISLVHETLLLVDELLFKLLLTNLLELDLSSDLPLNAFLAILSAPCRLRASGIDPAISRHCTETQSADEPSAEGVILV